MTISHMNTGDAETIEPLEEPEVIMKKIKALAARIESWTDLNDCGLTSHIKLLGNALKDLYCVDQSQYESARDCLYMTIFPQLGKYLRTLYRKWKNLTHDTVPQALKQQILAQLHKDISITQDTMALINYGDTQTIYNDINR